MVTEWTSKYFGKEKKKEFSTYQESNSDQPYSYCDRGILKGQCMFMYFERFGLKFRPKSLISLGLGGQ
jgi:hypothetical protein